MDEGPLRNFTLPARLVIVLGIISGVVGTWAYIVWVAHGLPAGSYPVFVFAAPVFLVAAASVGLGMLLLRACGIPIKRDEVADLPPPPQNSPSEK